MPRPAGSGADGGGVPAQEEGEDDISGTQFVCETVIRSMTLEEAPDHTPLRGPQPGTGDDQSIDKENVIHSLDGLEIGFDNVNQAYKNCEFKSKAEVSRAGY